MPISWPGEACATSTSAAALLRPEVDVAPTAAAPISRRPRGCAEHDLSALSVLQHFIVVIFTMNGILCAYFRDTAPARRRSTRRRCTRPRRRASRCSRRRSRSVLREARPPECSIPCPQADGQVPVPARRPVEYSRCMLRARGCSVQSAHTRSTKSDRQCSRSFDTSCTCIEKVGRVVASNWTCRCS